MDFSQILGFLVTMAAIIYMFTKRAKERHKGHSESGEHEERLDEFLRSLESDMDESKDFKDKPKSKGVKVTEVSKSKAVHKDESFQEEFKFRSGLDNFQTRTNIDERKLKIDIKGKYGDDYGEHLLSAQFRGEKIPTLIGYKRASRIKGLIRSLPSKKDMILLHEVLDKPKGFNVFR